MFSAISKKDADPWRARALFFRAAGVHTRGDRAGDAWVRWDFKHVAPHIQRKSSSIALIAIDTHKTEKSICPIGGMILRTGFNTGSQSCPSRRTPGA